MKKSADQIEINLQNGIFPRPEDYLLEQTMRKLKLPSLKEIQGSVILCHLADDGGIEIATTITGCSLAKQSGVLRLSINYPTLSGYQVEGFYIDPSDAPRDGKWPGRLRANRFYWRGTIQFL